MTPSSPPRVRIFSAYDAQIKGTRENQEDTAQRFAHGGTAYYAVLADGMGGHAQGEKASQLAVGAFAYSIRQRDSDLKEALLFAGSQIEQTKLSGKMEKGAGTTFIGVCVRTDTGKLSWASVGDSYLYLFRGGSLRLLNFRHTWGNKLDAMVQQGLLSAEAAASDPRRTRLYSALVGSDPTDMDCRSCMLSQGDIVILASDGLMGAFSMRRLEAYIASLSGCSAKVITQSLLTAVEEARRPSQDNTTVVVISCVPTSVKRASRAPAMKGRSLRSLSQNTLLWTLSGLVLVLCLLIVYMQFGGERTFSGSADHYPVSGGGVGFVSGAGGISGGGVGSGSGGGFASGGSAGSGTAGEVALGDGLGRVAEGITGDELGKERGEDDQKSLCIKSFMLMDGEPLFSLRAPCLKRAFTCGKLYTLDRKQTESSR